MTRGTFYLILADCYWRSVEFNGDMYPSGYGNRAFSLLQGVHTAEEFQAMVTAFNRSAHNYDDDPLAVQADIATLRSHLDLTKDYFDFWFSDWVFIKNLSGQSLSFGVYRARWSDRKTTYTLQHGQSVRFFYGRMVRRDRSWNKLTP